MARAIPVGESCFKIDSLEVFLHDRLLRAAIDVIGE
jgi:hypothetical protein